MENSKKSLILLLTIIGGGCLLAAIILFVCDFASTQRSSEKLDSMRASAEVQETQTESSTAPDTPVSPAPSDSPGADDSTATGSATVESSAATDASPMPSVQNPYADSFLENADMIAWLQIPDTNIDYPVMWTPENENKYLYLDFEGNEDKNGSLLLDTDSSIEPLTTNLIIHGHNMRSGAMFGNLTDYEDEDYMKEHSQITLYTEACARNYEIIAVFRSQVYKKTDQVFKFYKFFQADTQEEFDDFYNNIKALSLYDTGVTAQFGDHFLTLSTCVYHVEQGRFVVVAKEIESGDSYLPLSEQ